MDPKHQPSVNTLSVLLARDHRAGAADRVVRHASCFFAEALTAIELAHRGAQEENLRMHAANDTPSGRNRKLAAAHENLQGEIPQARDGGGGPDNQRAHFQPVESS